MLLDAEGAGLTTMQTDTLVRPHAKPPLPEAEVAEDWLPAPATVRRWRVPRRPVIAVVLLAAVVAGGYQGVQWWRPVGPAVDIQLFTVTRRSFPVVLQEEGELKAAQQIDIRCELEGRATIIKLIDEGKAVKKDDLLIELACDEIDDKVREAESKEILARAAAEAAAKELQILIEKNVSEIRKAEVKHSLARQAVEKYEQGDAVQSRQEAQLAVDEASYNLKRSEETLADSEDLYKQGFVTRLEVDNDRATVYQNRIKLKNAELALEVLNKYTIPMDTQQKQSDMQEAQKEVQWKQSEAAASEEKLKAELTAKQSDHKLAQDKLAKLRDQKKKTRILAPADGLVVYFKEEWWDDSRIIKTGAQVHEQQILIQLPDTSRMKVVVRVHEAKAEDLKVGLPAMVRIEGLTGRQFPARVSKVAVLADSKDGWLNPNLKEYETEVLLDGAFTDLKPGVTAHVEIKVADLKDVLAVPVQAVFGKGRRYFVFVRNGEDIKPVEVQIGLSSAEFVEIKGGLQGGESVCLAVSEEAKLMLPEDSSEVGAGHWSTSQPADTQPAASQPASSQAAATQPTTTEPATAAEEGTARRPA